jgi:hypothetical protein
MRIDEDSGQLFYDRIADTEPGSGIMGLSGDPLATSEELHVHLTLVVLDGIDDCTFDFGPAFILGSFEPPDRALHVLVARQATELGQ